MAESEEKFLGGAMDGSKRFVDMSPIEREFILKLMELQGNHAAELATTTLKTIVLVSLGGLSAVLTFVGTKGLDPRGWLVWAGTSFSFSVILSIVSLAGSYYVNLGGYRVVLELAHDIKDRKARTRWEKLWGAITDPCAWIAAGCLIAGLVFGALALGSLPLPK